MRTVILALAVLLHGGPAAAQNADGTVKPVNADANGLALKGYDAVAYLVEGRAAAGSPAFEQQWNGATWRFSTAANRDRFAAAPERYAPQFGGYCAWAVSRNYTADIDPEAFDVVNGKLYLNYSKLVQLRWKANRQANIVKAERNWPTLLESSRGPK